MRTETLHGLDLLSTAVLLLDARQRVRYLNPAAEDLLRASRKNMVGQTLAEALPGADQLADAVSMARQERRSVTRHDLELVCAGSGSPQRQVFSCTVTPYEGEDGGNVLVELLPAQQQRRIAREERLLDQTQANRELVRNLAHEIKNPLGAIRGAAQLLERELETLEQREYTQVIIKEADRLQSLMDRMLTPHRLPRLVGLNIHEVTERVRLMIQAEFPELVVERDYDISLPDLHGDLEQLIQAVLNIARNAAQAMKGHGRLTLRTRVLRRVTLAKRSYRLAICLDVIDDGPGIPEHLREHVFYPLVSGRDGGTGLGLTIAQTFVHQHHGLIEVESEPGRTRFTLVLPIPDSSTGQASDHRNGTNGRHQP